MSVEVEELQIQIDALRDCLASLSSDHLRAQEASAFLEQRVRRLESRSEGSPPPCDVPEPGPKAHADAAQPVVPASGVVVAEGAAQVQVAAEQGEEAEDDSIEECDLACSLWDAAFYVGLPQLSCSSSLILLASMLINAAVQAYNCVVLFTSDDFMQRRRFLELQGPMEEWRLAEAHQHSMVDGMGRSLASRVCGDDQSLSQAVRQADILGEINAYLALEPDDLVQTKFGTGPLLCGVCMVLFATTVMRELRSVMVTTWAACALPLRRATVLKGGRFHSLCAFRLAVVLVNNLARACICVMLLATGAYWLSSTTSITDLILNAAALGFVMDMDECLFETIVPASVQLLAQGLEPLRYRRSRLHSEALVPLVGIVAVVCGCVLVLVQPNIRDMLRVKEVLCGGQLDFSVTLNSMSYVVSARTMPFDTEQRRGLIGSAVAELAGTEAFGGSAMQFSMFASTRSSADEARSKTVAEFAEFQVCIDQDQYLGGFMMQITPHMFTAAREETGMHAGETISQRLFNCSEYTFACQSSKLARMMCPVACGCDDPTSGLLRYTSSHGCPRQCERRRSRRADVVSCEDREVVGTAGWDSYWNEMAQIMRVTGQPSEVDGYVAFMERKRTQGCNNTELFSVGPTDFCDATTQFLYSSHYSNTVSFCPASCCQRPNPPPNCPPTCSAQTSNFSR